tara:strand:+ start:8450 stop:10093 length:1644 start_codon:yes stop_codon:yes gene_type:complete
MDLTPEQKQELAELRRLEELEKRFNSTPKPVSPRESHKALYDAVDTGKELLGKALDGAGRVLDYAGGNARTAITDVGDEVFGDGELIDGKDYSNALKGKAPTSSEILQRLGASDDWKTTVAGLGLDIATDPLTYLTLGASSLGKAGKALRAFEKPTKGLAKSIHAAPFRKLNKAAIDYARKTGIPLSEIRKPTDILFDNHIWGTARGVDEKTLSHLKELSQRRNEIVDLYKHAKVNPDNATLPLKKHLSKLTSSDGAYNKDMIEEGKELIRKTYDDFSSQQGGVIKRLERKPETVMREVRGPSMNTQIQAKDLITGKPIENVTSDPLFLNYTKSTPTRNISKSSTKAESPMVDYATGKAITKENVDEVVEVIKPKKAGTLQDLDRERVALNSQVDSMYRDKGFSYTDGEIKQLDALRKGMRDEQINALNRAEANVLDEGARVGDEWAELGKEQGVILSGAKGLGQDVSRLENLGSVTQADSIIAGVAATNKEAMQALALKKLLQIAKSTPVATGTGVLLKKGAESGMNDVFIRELLKRANRTEETGQ